MYIFYKSLDIDECINGLHNCDENANCSNNDGGFQCVCKDGYFGNGTICLSKDHFCTDFVYNNCFINFLR